MSNADNSAATSSTSPVSSDDIKEAEQAKNGPTATQYISVACRFLAGFFTNTSLCTAFIEQGGLEWILDFATLPCVPYNFLEIISYGDELARLLQIFIEQKPYLTLPAILQRLQDAVDQLRPLQEHNEDSPFFAPFYDESSKASLNDVKITKGTDYAKALVVVQVLCHALSTTLQNQMFNHRASNNIFTQVNLADQWVRLFEGLGLLQRSCVWEEILLQKNMPKKWESSTRVKDSEGFGADEADNIFNYEFQALRSTQEIGTTNGPSGPIRNGENFDEPTSPSDVQSNAFFMNTRILRYLLSHIPTSITPLFHSLGRMLLIKRGSDSYQKQNAYNVAEQLAKCALGQIRWDLPKSHGFAKDRYAYWIIILQSTSNLMIDDAMDRQYPSTLTLILQHFKSLGGFSALSDVLDTFFDEVKSIIATHEDGEPREGEVDGLMSLALGGIKTILTFYSRVTNSKYITEAPQTQAMHTRSERDRERADYFVPAQFIVELRMAVIQPVQKMWQSDVMDKATTSIVQSLIEILRVVLEGEAEQGAYRKSDK
ncbi:hypothetical protein LTS18_011427, partial [Coniosporium uncinatum]